MNPTTSRQRATLGAAAMALLLAATPAVAPLLAITVPTTAEARPGFGGSFGSRGSHTYMAPPLTRTDPGGASPFDRSLTPRPSGGQYGGAYGGGFGGAQARSHPFAAGFGGALLGVGLGRMLFGGGYGGYGGGGGIGGVIGLLIELAILFFVGRWLWRRFASGRVTSRPQMFGMAGASAGTSANLAITTADYGQFEQALRDVQQAWSMQDLRSLSRFATPEMVSTFSEQMSDLASRNLRNVVSAVRMEQGDLSEAWSERGREYATVAMRYSMIDVTTDLTGRVVDGSPDERQMVTELWTFVRARGGSWLLSAIQQAR